MRTRRGITFIEILFVLTILGILLAIAIPTMAGTRDSAALKTAARDFVSAGQWARQVAISSGEQTFLIIYPKEDQWRLAFFDERIEDQQNWKERREPGPDELHRPLQPRISVTALRNDAGAVELGEEVRVAFYPNGASSGLAIQLENRRGAQITVDFDRGSGRPEVYSGPPKSFAAKLKENGFDPSEFGLVDDTVAAADVAKPGEGFSRVAGWTEEERVSQYKDAVTRMLERSRKQHEINEAGGAGAYYSEARQWRK
jgi:prepilin-type N-terminal cleavage/methylation domain-containing protein